jgi:IclR family transcriptional regulator, KDG regulon repressor
VKTLEKAFKIIELIEEHNGLKFNDLIELTSFKKSTVHRFLSFLIKSNYVRKDKKTTKYELGIKFLRISTRVLSNLNIRDNAEEHLYELNKATGETIHLAMLIGDEVIYIEKKESTQAIRMISQVGKKARLYCSGVGKAILAFQNKRFIEKKLDETDFEKYTDNTIVNREDLLEELKKIKKLGFSLDREENEKGICCIATPIRDHTGDVIASISVSAVKIRLDIDGLLEYKDMMLEKADLISRSLGYNSKK